MTAARQVSHGCESIDSGRNVEKNRVFIYNVSKSTEIETEIIAKKF